MLEKFTTLLDSKLSGPMGRLANQRHLKAVRDGIIATLPLIIVGSFFLIIANPPLPQDWGIYKFLTENAATILLPYRMTMYIMTMYATFGIGYSLSKSYDLDGVSGGILSTIAFMLTMIPVNVPADLNAGVAGFVLPMANLGGGGMFVGIVVSFIAVEIFKLTQRSKFKITMPEQVPPAVARSFESLTPTLIVILGMGSITYFIGFNWHSAIATIVTPIVSAADSLPSVLLITFLTCFFWSFGIHGASIVGSLARPIWLQLLDLNGAAQAAGTSGTALPAISAEPFYQWFIWIGGSGCTIGLAILLAFATKSQYGKKLGRTAFAPACFNINEPLIFGTPIVLNPILIIPFIIAPTLCAIIAWLVTSAGLVNRVIVTAPWTLPGPIGAYIATGGDFRAIILSLVLIVLSVIIYYPFVKMYDKKLLLEEAGQSEATEDGAEDDFSF